MKNSETRKLEDMPFYKSMMKVQAASGLDPLKLILWQLGFKAVPAACTCGKHEWSAFDLMLEAEKSGDHPWEFFRNYSATMAVPQSFRTAKLDTGLTCPECGLRSAEILVDYNYSTQCCHSANALTGLPLSPSST